MDRLKRELERFTQDVIPRDCPEIQYIEMRRSFMGGASSMLCIMGELAELGNDSVSVAEIDKLVVELNDFVCAVARGEA